MISQTNGQQAKKKKQADAGKIVQEVLTVLSFVNIYIIAIT